MMKPSKHRRKIVLLCFLLLTIGLHLFYHRKTILEKAKWNNAFEKTYLVDGGSYDYFDTDTGSSMTVQISTPPNSSGDLFYMNFWGSSGTYRTKEIEFQRSRQVPAAFHDLVFGAGNTTREAGDWICVQSDSMTHSANWLQPIYPRRPIKANSWSNQDYGSMFPLNTCDVYVKHIAQFQYPSSRVVSAVEFRIVPGHLSSDSKVAS
jgi:hypothetical protein